MADQTVQVAPQAPQAPQVSQAPAAPAERGNQEVFNTEMDNIRGVAARERAITKAMADELPDDFGIDTMIDNRQAENTAEAEEGSEAPPPEAEVATPEKLEEGETSKQEPEADESDRWAVLTEQEQTIRKLRAQTKEMEAAVQAAKQQNPFDEFRKNPFAFMEKAGLSFDTLAEAVVKGETDKVGQAAPKDPMADAPTWARELFTKVQGLEQQTRQQEHSKNDAVYRQNASEVLKKEQYAILETLSNAEEQIYQIALAHAERTGEVLPPEVIADTLAEEWTAHLKKVGTNKALLAAIGAKVEAPPASDKPALVEFAARDKRTENKKRSIGNNVGGASSVPSKGETTPRNNVIDEAAQMLGDDVWGSIES
jgi:hypothetical protein